MKHQIDIETVLILKRSFARWYKDERFFPPGFDSDAFDKGAKSAFDHIYKTLCRHNGNARAAFLRPNAKITGAEASGASPCWADSDETNKQGKIK